MPWVVSPSVHVSVSPKSVSTVLHYRWHYCHGDNISAVFKCETHELTNWGHHWSLDEHAVILCLLLLLSCFHAELVYCLYFAIIFMMTVGGEFGVNGLWHGQMWLWRSSAHITNVVPWWWCLPVCGKFLAGFEYEMLGWSILVNLNICVSCIFSSLSFLHSHFVL